MKISLATLGCKVNHYDSAAMAELLRKDGHEIVPFPSPADLYVVNTCTVTAKTDYQSRQLVRRIRRDFGNVPVVVTGCYAQTNPGDLAALEGVALVLGNGEKPRLHQWIGNLPATGAAVHVGDMEGERECFSPPVAGLPGRTRAFLKIQDGCDGRCSYCIVPRARGRSRSLPPEEVLRRMALLSEAGFAETVLTGVHLGCYGEDLDPPADLPGLLRDIEKRGGAGRLRLSSIEPAEVSGAMVSFWKESSRLCHHAHIPLQSGSDAVLGRMGRPYDSAFFRNLVESLVEAVPDMAVGVDVMTGFPGETEEDFRSTVTLLRELPVAYLHVFPYSKRPGTAASSFAGHVREEVKKARAAELRTLSVEKRTAFAVKFIGKPLSVLVEGKKDGETGLLRGFSGNYIPCLVRGGGNIPAGRTVTVIPEEQRGGVLVGQAESPAR
jgi:threonylcarbamoyladenosine tRNA methylthiotransferase MtaB